jgi:uncharacterized protein YecE (DUF72 family)
LPPASQKLPGASPQKTSNKLTVATAIAAPARNLFAGTSGWAYPGWKPGFYPANVPARAFLGYYAGQLNSVEVNYTFRKLPSLAQLQGWLDATPASFRFSFKAPQRITHFQRLRESEIAVAEFVAALQPARTSGKLGPLLFQLPPNFTADNARLSAFLGSPALAGLQIAFEFRHPSWFSEATYSVLRRHHAALCVAESDDLETPDVATANFLCYRLRRSGGYPAKQIGAFAKRFAAVAMESELFVYFKHEDEPTGALNAVALLQAAAKFQAGLRK